MSAPPPSASDASLGELVARLSEQTSRLVREEMRLARAEMTQKGKAAGLGLGLVGGAGVFAFYGFGAIVTAAILGLSRVLSGWLAAVIVAVALFAIAGLAALAGKKEVTEATPPTPTQTIDSIKADVGAVKQGIRA